MKRKLFQKIDPDELRVHRINLRFTEAEMKVVKEAAEIRQLVVTDYLRRTALKRKADVSYDLAIVFELREIVRVVKLLIIGMIEHGLEPPRAEAVQLIKGAIAATLRIQK